MQHLLNKFKDPALGNRILDRIRNNFPGRFSGKVTLMEVCGTHTHAISRLAIRELLAEQVDLKSGPGCPVCVTDSGDIDRMIAYAGLPGVILTTFGDMMRVPGSQTSLADEKARGTDIRVVYSPLDAIKVAIDNPGRQVIFLGIGFETTVPVVALALIEAEDLGLNNFTVDISHKLTPPAVEALLQDAETNIQGLICPGHVSVVIGRQGWDFLGQKYGRPGVVAGFEPVDILGALAGLLEMVAAGESRVVNGYSRAVREAGNPNAQNLMQKYFTPVPARWRGLGLIPGSGLRLRGDYGRYDAQQRFQVETPPTAPPRGCACGDVLKGKTIPFECALFGTACTPRRPVGPCMVSGEGACAAYYRYERGRQAR